MKFTHKTDVGTPCVITAKSKLDPQLVVIEYMRGGCYDSGVAHESKLTPIHELDDVPFGTVIFVRNHECDAWECDFFVSYRPSPIAMDTHVIEAIRGFWKYHTLVNPLL